MNDMPWATDPMTISCQANSEPNVIAANKTASSSVASENCSFMAASLPPAQRKVPHSLIAAREGNKADTELAGGGFQRWVNKVKRSILGGDEGKSRMVKRRLLFMFCVVLVDLPLAFFECFIFTFGFWMDAAVVFAP